MALQAATSKEGWNNRSHGRQPGHQYLVASRGDDVVVVGGLALTVGKALAPIDSVAKAAVVASLDRGIGVSCERSVRKVAGGFAVHLETSSCFGPRDEVIGVAVSGETSVVSAEQGPSTCVGSLGPREEVVGLGLAAAPSCDGPSTPGIF